MICDSCKSISFHLSYRYNKDIKKTVCFCENCSDRDIRLPGFHDVYLAKGETSNSNIYNKDEGHPYLYSTKAEKAAIMKKLNITEAGDRVHGAR